MSQVRPGLRRLANCLTTARFAVAAAIVVSALPSVPLDGPHRLRWLGGLLLLGWTTDLGDGPLARASGLPSPRWAMIDQWADIILLWATALALGLNRLLPLSWVAAGLVAFVLAVSRWPTKNVIQILSLPVELLPLLVFLRHDPTLAVWFAFWLIGALVVDWRRLFQLTAEFIDRLTPARQRPFQRLRDWIGARLGGR